MKSMVYSDLNDRTSQYHRHEAALLSIKVLPADTTTYTTTSAAIACPNGNAIAGRRRCAIIGGGDRHTTRADRNARATCLD
jgi:hypothetical protein